MKKKLLLVLGLSSVLVLAGCGQENGAFSSNDGDSSSTKGTMTLTYKDFAEKFNANFETKAVSNEGTITTKGFVDLAKDHLTTVYQHSAENFSPYESFYAKGKTGDVQRQHLNEHNEVVNVHYKDDFDTTVVNAFADVEEGVTPVLAENGSLTEIGKKFLATMTPLMNLESSGVFTNVTSSIELNERCIYTFNATVNGTISLELKSTLVNPADYEARLLSPLPETGESKKLGSMLERLRENNYTCTITKVGENAPTKVYYLNPTKLLEVEGTNKYGYLKTEDGYDNVVIKNDKPTIGTHSSDTFASLVPSFDFAPEIVVDGSLSLKCGSVDTHSFLFSSAPFYGARQFKDVEVKGDSLSFVYGSVLDSVQSVERYIIVFSDIGKTSLPIDISKTAVDNWEGTSEKVHNFFVSILGENYNIPAWSDFDWDVTVGKDNSFITLVATVDDVDEGTSSVKAYIQKLSKVSSLKRWTNAEWENTKPLVETGDHANGTDELYHLNDQYSLQVYFFEDEYGLEGGSFAGLTVHETSYFLKD